MRLSSKLKHAQFSGAEMRILQASKNQLVQIISVMVLIVLGSCTVLPVPKHIEVTYPVVSSRNKNTVLGTNFVETLCS